MTHRAALYLPCSRCLPTARCLRRGAPPTPSSRPPQLAPFCRLVAELRAAPGARKQTTRRFCSTRAFTIRRATLADAERVTKISRQNFTETFGHLYPPEDLAQFLESSLSLEAQRAMLRNGDDYAVWLLERGGEALGHAVVGPASLPHPDVAEGDGELKRLYILKEAHNGGLGGRLLQTALDWLLQRDGVVARRTLWLGVWSENVAAQRLYRRYGFETVGEHLFTVGGVNDLDFIMRRPADYGV
jgi:ribosomal protein S18 acetylase RimI-like enzyme